MVIDDLPRSAFYSRYVVRRFRWQGAMWGASFRNFLMTLAKEHELEGWLLLPVQDEVVELIARHTEEFAQRYRLVTPEWHRLRWAHDKRLLYGVAAALSVPHPQTWYPSSERDLAELPIVFPAIIKPAISVRLQYAMGRKALAADSHASLRHQYRAAAAVVGAEDLMVQEVVPGDGRSQYSVGTFCKSGSVVAAMSVRRRRQYPLDYGLGSSFVEAVEVPELIELAAHLLRRLRLSGMVEVEFKHDARDGLYKLLDVNVRPWGWHTLCIASGLDFPYLQYADALGWPTEPVNARYGHRWRRLLTDVPAAFQEMRQGIISPGDYLGSLLAGKTVPSVLDYRDPLPVLADLAIAVSRSWKGTNRGRSTIPLEHSSPAPISRESERLAATLGITGT
jgi:predicted ATP-grasp superfamily ATP-dependent carboligase